MARRPSCIPVVLVALVRIILATLTVKPHSDENVNTAKLLIGKRGYIYDPGRATALASSEDAFGVRLQEAVEGQTGWM